MQYASATDVQSICISNTNRFWYEKQNYEWKYFESGSSNMEDRGEDFFRWLYLPLFDVRKSFWNRQSDSLATFINKN